MINRILKVKIANLLTSPVLGKIIATILNDKLPYHGLIIDTADSNITPNTKAMIFWRLYESAEYRYINQYLPKNLPVVELGSSIGIISAVIKRLINENLLICVEANPNLIHTLKNNLRYLSNYFIENYAIDYSCEMVEFNITSSNLESKIGKHKSSKTKIRPLNVQTIQLNKIIEKYQLEQYALVSDIEGAEIQILLKENLKNCLCGIFELHTTEFENQRYSIADMKNLIKNKGFKIIADAGNVIVFQKSDLLTSHENKNSLLASCSTYPIQ